MYDQELIFVVKVPIIKETEHTEKNIDVILEINSIGIDATMYDLKDFTNKNDFFLNKDNYQNLNVDNMKSNIDYTLQYLISKL
jgi:hypothetical protein